MSDPQFTIAGVEALGEAMERHTDAGGDIPGLVWLVARREEVHAGAAGMATLDGPPMRRDSLVRVASLTKAVTAAGALSLVDEGVLGLDEPIERWLPELADRRVLRRQDGPLDDTVPAERSITVRDLLAFTAGYGHDFSAYGRQTQIAEFARLGLGVGPPAPATMPTVDEWMARLSGIPLDHQPGAAWRYDVGSDIAGVLLARVAGMPLEDVLRARVFEPLGMVDTSFSVDSACRDRFTTCYDADPDTGLRRVYDPVDGQWASPPPFPSGGGGLVSTVDDFCAFGQMLLAGGRAGGSQVVSAASVAEMTRDQLDPDGPGITPEGDVGWGFGVDVQRRPGSGPRSPGSYGWVGGLGTTWMNDPTVGLVGVLFTNQALTSPEFPAVMTDFWQAAYAALA